MRALGRWSKISLGLGVLLATSAALADGSKVKVSTQVVLASNKGTAVEPPQLAKMKDEFAKQGISYTSWKQQSAANLWLESGKANEVSLPGGRQALLKLKKLEAGTATVHVTIPRLLDTDYKLGRTGSVYIRSGDHEGGVLILVLSPPNEVKPRKAEDLHRPGQTLPRAAEAHLSAN
jgi:hypothetical protein